MGLVLANQMHLGLLPIQSANETLQRALSSWLSHGATLETVGARPAQLLNGCDQLRIPVSPVSAQQPFEVGVLSPFYRERIVCELLN